MALDPGFAGNGFVYVTYVAAEPYPHHRVSRFTARGDVAAAGQRGRPVATATTSAKLGGNGAGGPPGRGAALRRRRQAVHRHRRADGRRARPAARHLPGQAAPDQPRRHDPRGQSRSSQKAKGKYRASGRSACATRSRSPCSRGRAGSSSTTWATTSWEEVNEGFAGANYGWPDVRGPDAPTRGSAPRSTPTRSRRSPAGPSARTARESALPAGIPRSVLLHGFRPGLDQGPRP